MLVDGDICCYLLGSRSFEVFLGIFLGKKSITRTTLVLKRVESKKFRDDFFLLEYDLCLHLYFHGYRFFSVPKYRSFIEGLFLRYELPKQSYRDDAEYWRMNET